MRGIFTGMLVLGLLFIITFMKFTTLHIRACESFTALNEQYCHIIQVSAHVQMDGSSLDTMMYVFMINQQKIFALLTL